MEILFKATDLKFVSGNRRNLINVETSLFTVWRQLQPPQLGWRNGGGSPEFVPSVYLTSVRGSRDHSEAISCGEIDSNESKKRFKGKFCV
jgi:hypothetical protein